MNASNTLLQLEHVSIVRQQRALLDNVNASFNDTGITVILGHNGAGKSLLMQVCNRLIRADQGRVVRYDQGRGHLPHLLLPQRPLILRRNVRENILHPLKLAQVPSAKRSLLTEQALELCQLSEKQNQAAPTLSGGEQQRVAIARAWALGARTVWLDEPCAHLDPQTTRKIDSLLLKLREEGHKVVLCTHNIAQAKRLADDVMFMENGKTLEHTEGSAFFRQPNTESAAHFLNHE